MGILIENGWMDSFFNNSLKTKKYCSTYSDNNWWYRYLKEAKAFLKNFPEFDIAVWGEGEIPIIQLVDIIENGGNLE